MCCRRHIRVFLQTGKPTAPAGSLAGVLDVDTDCASSGWCARVAGLSGPVSPPATSELVTKGCRTETGEWEGGVWRQLDRDHYFFTVVITGYYYVFICFPSICCTLCTERRRRLFLSLSLSLSLSGSTGAIISLFSSSAIDDVGNGIERVQIAPCQNLLFRPLRKRLDIARRRLSPSLFVFSTHEKKRERDGERWR